jgi:hypothetical protein
MKKKKIIKIYEAVSLQLTFMLIIGTMIQSCIAEEINTDDEVFDNNKFDPPPKQQANKYRIWGQGQLAYIFPMDLNGFVGRYWEDGTSKLVDGYIENSDIYVFNRVIRFVGSCEPGWSRLFALKFQPFRFFFRLIFPKSFVIQNYTGEIYCKYISFSHGPAWTIYSLSGEADGFLKK